MTIYCLPFLILLFQGHPIEEDVTPTPFIKQDCIDYLKSIPGQDYNNPSSIEAVQKLFQESVSNWITSDGDLKSKHSEAGLFIMNLETLSILLAEHYQLRGLDPKAVISRFGRPNRILGVKDIDCSMLQETEPFNNYPSNGHKQGKAKCYEYNDKYVWFFKGEVTGISPRSIPYDNYLKKNHFLKTATKSTGVWCQN